MSSMDMLDVGQANELKLACRRNNVTTEDLKWLCEGDVLAKVRDVRYGRLEFAVPMHLIDCNADPEIPDSFKLKEHHRGGDFAWDATKVKLIFDLDQMGGKLIQGDELRKKLEGARVLNVNVRDYLLKHPHLIPVEWRRKGVAAIYFWGTIFENSSGFLCVPLLTWRVWEWCGGFGLLRHDFGGAAPAAIRVD
jgi:hypothetical protein